MDRTFQLIRDYPVIAGLLFAGLLTCSLLAFLGYWMRRAGVSRKPLLFFAGYLAIIALPQGVVHLLEAYTHALTHPPARPAAASGKPAGLKPVPWKVVFGPQADPDLNIDAKGGLDAILHDAQTARLSFSQSGESALAARFKSAAAAEEALNRYGTFFHFRNAEGSDERGWTAQRYQGQGEWNHVVTAGNELYAWTAPTRKGVEAERIRALGPMSVPTQTPQAAASGGTPVSRRLAENPRAMIAFLTINGVLAVLWFFKGSAWAARIAPVPGAPSLDETALHARLFAVQTSSMPVDVRTLEGGRELEVTWRYGDARWLDMQGVNRMRRVHKLVLAPDERSRKVRVREYWSRFDASVAPDAARLEWMLHTGIQFFQVEHVRVLGAQLAPDGRPTGEMSAGYHFNLQELKAPFIQATNAAGWIWQPLVWNAPSFLRPLTE